MGNGWLQAWRDKHGYEWFDGYALREGDMGYGIVIGGYEWRDGRMWAITRVANGYPII